MTTHTYSLLAKFIYRWANIPLTIILVFYLIVYILAAFYQWYYVFAVMFEGAILFFLNRHYIKGYKLFPYKISVDDEKLVCEDFLLSDKTVTIRFSDITDIKGSIFSGNKSRPLYIYDGNNNQTIAIRIHLKGYNQVVTKILSNVSKDIYDSLLDRMKEFNEIVSLQRQRRKKK